MSLMLTYMSHVSYTDIHESCLKAEKERKDYALYRILHHGELSDDNLRHLDISEIETLMLSAAIPPSPNHAAYGDGHSAAVIKIQSRVRGNQVRSRCANSDSGEKRGGGGGQKCACRRRSKFGENE
jgi:hypothetical protein